MVTIKVLDMVEKCSTNDDGAVVYNMILSRLLNGEPVNISFSGAYIVTTSFINTAFIELLEVMPFSKIKELLFFSNTTRPINNMIKERFAFEVQKKESNPAAVYHCPRCHPAVC